MSIDVNYGHVFASLRTSSKHWHAYTRHAFVEAMRDGTLPHDALLHYLKVHVETCAQLCISEIELLETIEASENLAYTRYVLEAGYSGDFISLLATLAPCVFGYGEIGLRLKQDKTSDTYLEWIDTYAGEEYQDVCKGVAELLDNAVINRLGDGFETLPIWENVKEQFDTATRLEVSFWGMGLRP
jgi:thiaminase/transcriptional activator TenA